MRHLPPRAHPSSALAPKPNPPFISYFHTTLTLLPTCSPSKQSHMYQQQIIQIGKKLGIDPIMVGLYTLTPPDP
jgi:hypothetical protein